MAYIVEGLLSKEYLRLRFGGLIIGILRYIAQFTLKHSELKITTLILRMSY